MELPRHAPSSVNAFDRQRPDDAPLFTREDLIAALASYEDLPCDLILDASDDVAFSPLESPPPDPTVSDTSSGSPPPPLVAPSSTTRRPRSRQLRDEHAFLCEQIAQLERELARIKTSQRAGIHGVPRVTAWKDVATRQRVRRTLAEQEHERLRVKLLRQIQVAKSLQVVLQHRPHHINPTHHHALAIPATEDKDAWMDDLGHVLRHFVADIDRAYNAMDTVLVPVDTEDFEPSQRLPSSVVKAHTVDGIEQLYVETRQAFVVPFAFCQVAAVAWRAFTSQFERQQRQLELYCRADDLFACQFAGRPLGSPPTSSADDAGTKYTATTIARRYASGEADRSVVVWRGFIAPRESSTLRDAVAVGTGWMVLEPFAGGADCTVANVCIRTVPQQQRQQNTVVSLAQQHLVRLPTESPELATSTLRSQRLCTTSEDMMAVMEEIENILLDEATTTVKPA